MTRLTTAAVAALLAAGAPAGAATIDAIFEGVVDLVEFTNTSIMLGDTVRLTVTGSDVPNEVSIPDDLRIPGAEQSVFQLERMTLEVVDRGLSLTSQDPLLQLVNDEDLEIDAFPGQILDGVALTGDIPGGVLGYEAIFNPNAIQSTDFVEAQNSFFAGATYLAAAMGVVYDGAGSFPFGDCDELGCALLSTADLVDVIITDDPLPPMDDGGIGDDMGNDDGGLKDVPAPIPLPAGMPLLAAGLGALAFLRRRKG